MLIDLYIYIYIYIYILYMLRKFRLLIKLITYCIWNMYSKYKYILNISIIILLYNIIWYIIVYNIDELI